MTARPDRSAMRARKGVSVAVPPHEACMRRLFVAGVATISKKSGELTQVKDSPAAGVTIEECDGDSAIGRTVPRNQITRRST